MCTHTNLVLIVASIWHIEGGAHTKYPYGIKSIDTKGDIPYAKRICENTVRNNLIRWRKKGAQGCYLDFLADVYCPPTSDNIGNKNWKKNIRNRYEKRTN